jgi:hypothetical protein
MSNESGFHRPVAGALASVLLLGALKAAEAQSEAPRFELSGGYAFLRDLGDESVNVPLGWNASLARNFTESFGVVADIGGHYKSESGVTFNEHSFLGGARYSFRRDRVVPYLEALGGVVRGGASAGGLSVSTWDYAFQGGGGLGYRVKENLLVRGGVDFRNIFSEGESFQQLRVLVGVTFGLGTRGEADVSPPPPPPPPRTPTRPEPGSTVPPVSSPPITDEPAPPPEVQEPARPPLPAPARPAVAPPPAPSPIAQGHAFLRGGDYAQAADAFRDHLRRAGAGKFTIPVGLFCDTSNIAPLVQGSGDPEPLFLLSAPRGGRSCYGLYWGLFDSRAEAQHALAAIPAALRAAGQAPIAVSRLLP